MHFYCAATEIRPFLTGIGCSGEWPECDGLMLMQRLCQHTLCEPWPITTSITLGSLLYFSAYFLQAVSMNLS